MRKTIALVLAFVQIAFGGFLISNGGRAEKSKKEKIEEILNCGTELLFSPERFTYQWKDEYEDPFTVDLRLTGDVTYSYFNVTVNEQGVAIFGDSVETPEGDLYYATDTGEVYCIISEETLKTVFSGQTDDRHVYRRSFFQPEKNRFKVNERWVPVYVVGRLWRGNIVYTGLVVDGVRY